MASGCFPIVTDLPGNKSFISNGLNGLLAHRSSHSSLEEKIIWTFENSEFLEKAVRENRRFAAESLSRDQNMQLFFKRYSDIIKKIG